MYFLTLILTTTPGVRVVGSLVMSSHLEISSMIIMAVVNIQQDSISPVMGLAINYDTNNSQWCPLPTQLDIQLSFLSLMIFSSHTSIRGVQERICCLSPADSFVISGLMSGLWSHQKMINITFLCTSLFIINNVHISH